MKNVFKINDNKFKGIVISCNLSFNITKEKVVEYAIISSILSKTNKKFGSYQEMEKHLASLYGARFDANVEKIGDLYNMEFRIEFVNKKYIDNEDVLDKCLDFLYTTIFGVADSNSDFDNNVVEREIAFIEQKINERKDEKLRYGVIKTEELLCENEPFGVYVYGREEDLKNVTKQSLYNTYMEIIKKGCFSVIVTGNLDGYDDIDKKVEEKFKEKMDNNVDYTKLKEGTSFTTKGKSKIQEVKEEAKIVQSVITMGFNIEDVKKEDTFSLSMFNAILGETPSSKLFQNFREKESLAYTVRSRYYRYKGIVIIYAGIDMKNYERAKKVILNQIEDIQEGKVTQEEFYAAKESLISDLLEWYDLKLARAKLLLCNMLMYQDDEYTLEKMIEEIKKVTLQDVQKVAKKVKLQTIYLLGGGNNE